MSISFSSATQIWSTTANQNQVLWIDLVNWEAWDFVWVSWINYNSNNIFEITSQWWWNFIYNNWQSYNNIFQWTFANWYSKWIFFWNDWKLIFHSNYSSSASWNPTYIVQKFSKVSSSEIWNFSNYSFDYSLEDVLSSGISLDHQVFAFKRWNDWSLTNSSLTFSSTIIYCLWDWNTFYCASCVPWWTYNNPSCNWWVQSIDLWLTKWSTIVDINSLWLNQNSPFKVKSDWSIVSDPRFSAQNIYDSYRKLWYSDVLCYWWFGINDKFWTWNSSLNWIKIWSGAFITDLYNSYPYDFYNWESLNIVDWYDSWDFEYWFFKDQHDLYEFSYYDWLSRGFVWLFMVRDYFFKWSNFDSSTLISFCEFSLANDPLIDKSTTPIDIISDTVNENELNKLIWNIWVIKPWTWSALDVLSRFISWYNEDDYFSLFLSWYDTIDSLEIPSNDYPWILPNYIIVWFLGIMLLYILKH